MSKVGILLLAAGESKRMGQPKQLLRFQEESLLHRAARLASDCGQTVVVLGAYADQLRLELTDLPVWTEINPNWQTGIASSLRIGLTTLQMQISELNGVLVMLCDQPFVDRFLLEKLMAAHPRASLIACRYGGSLGVPALFDQCFFPALLALEGDQGAKKIILANCNSATTIDFPKGMFDIDTPGDYRRLCADEPPI